MWVAGPGISAGAATFGYGHLKILILAAGLVMMDLAAAITVSLMWFGSRHYIQPLNENKVENEYSYRAGYRDATLRFLQPGPGLQLVRPAMHVPAQTLHGYAAEQKGPMSM